MTEAEWLGFTDPRPMLEFFAGKKTDRKLRLFLVACCRRVWHLLRDVRCRPAVVVAEKYADGVASEVERASAFQAAEKAMYSAGAIFHARAKREMRGVVPADYRSTYSDLFHAAVCVTTALELPERLMGGHDGPHSTPTNGAQNAAWALCGWRGTNHEEASDRETAEQFVQTRLLHDIFGNPFCPVEIDPVWLTPTVTSLARTIYYDRILPVGTLDHSLFGVLADALGEAGCDNQEILNHCRQKEHVRGCWVIDLVLAKG